jgi:cyanophycinase-like exopeptidase
MKTTYRHLLEHVDAKSITILDSSYGFQENADELTERLQQHFRDAFGLKTKVASLRHPDADRHEKDRFLETIGESEVVFAGPGSPSYACRVWEGLSLRDALAGVVDRGGAVVMASAAAITLGVKALPVYEIYKVGADPSWIEGLDLLSLYGLSVVVVPHWNNQEGGTHDTSHCFIGASRFRRLVDLLPPSVSVLGVDEHTSLSFHGATGTMRVLGAGEAHFNDNHFDSTMTAPGFVTRPPLPELAARPAESHPFGPLIDLLIELRQEARRKGEFATSDLIRSRLAAAGVELRDTTEGTDWN